MPIYEFVCDKCGKETEIHRPMSEAGDKAVCTCGHEMRRRFSLIDFLMTKTGRDKILGILNQEEGAQDFPGGDKHRARYSQAMAKGLDPPRQTVGRGF
jgi:putative FmdB family regulatory protein